MRAPFLILGLLLSASLGQCVALSQEKPTMLKPAIEKGLAWLVKQQSQDGSWPDVMNRSDVGCTGAAGLALLMEGSTAVKGKYADNIQRAVDRMMQNCQKGKDDGLVGANARENRLGYMAGQSYAVLFLASAYAREEKSDAKDLDARLARARQAEMEGVLKRAVQFIGKAQTDNGGWAPISSQDRQVLDEAPSTLQQILALRAVQQAGVDVPKDIIQKAHAYLEKMTTPRGGMPFSSLNAGAEGRERPGLTIAAVASTYGSDQINPQLLKKWLKYCESTITLQTNNTQDSFHLAVAVHGLGDEGWARLLDTKEPWLLWSKDRDRLLARFRAAPGTAHRDWNPNPVFAAAMNLVALQLDNDHLPIFRRKRNW